MIKLLRLLLTPFMWLKNILDPQWWANLIGNKTGLFHVQKYRYRRWLETLPPERRCYELGVAIRLMILMDHYILMLILAWQCCLGTGIGVEDND